MNIYIYTLFGWSPQRCARFIDCSIVRAQLNTASTRGAEGKLSVCDDNDECKLDSECLSDGLEFWSTEEAALTQTTSSTPPSQLCGHFSKAHGAQRCASRCTRAQRRQHWNNCRVSACSRRSRDIDREIEKRNGKVFIFYFVVSYDWILNNI